MGAKNKVSDLSLDPMRYLKQRGGKWHYVRRVPKQFAHIDTRGTIQESLRTSSTDVARLRRDARENADDLYWQGIIVGEVNPQVVSAGYEAAKARAAVLGFEYKSYIDLHSPTLSADEILRHVEAYSLTQARDVNAALGLVAPPELTVRQAMNLFLDDIGLAETKGMSAAQKASWRKVKLAAAERFCESVSDKPLLKISRADATKFYKDWQAKVLAGNSGNTGNRSIGNLRKLFRIYTQHLAIDLPNPFDRLSFSDPKSQRLKVKPFETEFIRANFIQAGSLKSLNSQAKLIFLALIETGCRPSEVCNLTAEQIHLDAPVPYLSIVYREDRRVKTENSVRDVPLVGVSLEAMKRAPKGFPKYFDKETNLSAVLMKHLRTQKLIPSKHHRVYSIRHSYEKRMLEAGYDDEFRRRILGHDTDRPDYGDGGALSWRQERMIKIALPYDPQVFEGR